MASTSTRIVLSFLGDTGGVIRLNIPRARANITTTEATTAMNALIATNNIVGKAGIASSIKSAHLVNTTRTNVV
jgi:hypothetical protein